MKDHILEMMDNNTLGIYNYKNDISLEKNLIGKNVQLQRLMEDKLKAVIQTYNGRLIDNNMIVRKPE
jgi:hypothetical protein